MRVNTLRHGTNKEELCCPASTPKIMSIYHRGKHELSELLVVPYPPLRPSLDTPQVLGSFQARQLGNCIFGSEPAAVGRRCYLLILQTRAYLSKRRKRHSKHMGGEFGGGRVSLPFG